MSLHRPLYKLTLLLSLNILFAPAQAASPDTDPDSNQPVHIEADKLQASQKAQHARYSGHVTVRQGKFELYADTLDVYVEQNKLKKLIARGKPARFKKYDYAQNSWTHGQALTITYTLTPQKQLLLEQKARITREKGEMLSGARILYYLTTHTLKAESQGKERVHVVLPPEESKQTGGSP